MAKPANWRAPRDGYISSADAAHRSGYTIEQIVNLAKTGRLLAHHVSGKWHIDERALDAFVVNQEMRPRRGSPVRSRPAKSRESWFMAEPSLQRWAIYLIRNRGELVGLVEAPDQKGAIGVAIEKYMITDVEQQNRLVARHVGKVRKGSFRP
jgi:hypothetical protein